VLWSDLAAAQSFTSDIVCLYDSDCDVTGGTGTCDNHLTSSGMLTGHCGFIVCSDDVDCPTQESCMGGVCSTTCSTTTDCHFGSECSSGRCYSLEPGRADYCKGSPCPRNLGDCDSDSECAAGLQCVSNVGNLFGYDASDDVCTDMLNGAGSHCDSFGPCDHGYGDCDSDSECGWLLKCGHNNGASFGFSSSTDVCIWLWE
jgi:hypothetical protein